MATTKKLFFAAILAVVFASSTDARVRHAHRDIVRATCVHARYPNLCLRTLSAYTGPAITNPRDLAQAAVKISLSHVRRVAAKLAAVYASAKKRRERAVLVDCAEQLGDSVDELRRTLGVLKHLRRRRSGGDAAAEAEFRWEMSNAETWVSAALTDEDTCLDGFEGIGNGEIKREVKRKITKVARITSNALYMINRLDVTRGKPNADDP